MKNTELNLWITTLGWTLLHSLWQAAVVFFVYRLASHWLSGSSAAVRYLLSTVSMAGISALSAITFIYLKSATAADVSALTESETLARGQFSFINTASSTLLESFSLWLNNHLTFFVAAWLAGVVLLSLRLSSAWWYSTRLKNSALLISGFWEEQLHQLACDLRITGKILLAQSSSVRSPVVLGYLKPIILLPVGMLSGLTADQVESILIHELAHIRRHDYVINVLQSIMEVVFFFNPMVWMISSRMRTEREQCCDDIVIRFKNPLTYARALHQLEEERIGNTAFGLAAAGSENQLLQRIKRIMETTEKKERGGRKIVPALAIVVLLIGGSWLSVQATRADDHTVFEELIAGDTLIKEKAKAKGKVKPLTLKLSEPVPEVVEVPHVELAEPAVAPVPEVIEIEDIPEAHELTLDFPHNVMTPHQFEEFTEKFKERFGDFYKQHEKEMQKMMDELWQQELKEQHAMVELQRAEIMQSTKEQLKSLELARKMSELDLQRAKLEFRTSPDAAPLQFSNERLSSLREAEEHAKELALHEKGMSDRELVLADQARHEADIAREQHELHELRTDDPEWASLDGITERNNPFNKMLTEQLVKDKYLKKGEEIKSMLWEDENIVINDKKISEKDSPKYRKIMDDFMKTKVRLHQSPPLRLKKPGRAE